MDVNAHIVNNIRETFCAVVKCECGETQRLYFRADEVINPQCRRCRRQMPVYFNELDRRKITKAAGRIIGSAGKG